MKRAPKAPFTSVRERPPVGGGEPARAPGAGRYPRGHSAAERRALQRRRLIEAASVVFARGFSVATVEDLVTCAGMSRRTFYEHFDDLAAALAEVQAHAVDEIVRAMSDAAGTTTDPVEQVRVGVEAFLGVLCREPALARVAFVEIRAAGPGYALHHQRSLERIASLVAGWMNEGPEGAHGPGAPDPISMYALVAAVESVGMRYVERRRHKRVLEAAPALVRMILRTWRAKD